MPTAMIMAQRKLSIEEVFALLTSREGEIDGQDPSVSQVDDPQEVILEGSDEEFGDSEEESEEAIVDEFVREKEGFITHGTQK